ncbi:MAG: hypothetical protein ABIQ35_02325 [Verrucomicrobiota bacterium]
MYSVRAAILFFFLHLLGVIAAQAELSIGPIYDEFPLVLAPGKRMEAAGPIFSWEEKESQRQFALPPLFSRTVDPDVESEEIDVLYPLLTYDRYGAEYRFQVLQLFSFAGGKTQAEEKKGRFTLFPIYFQQRSSRPEFNYTAVLPFYGTLRNRLFRDEIHFVMFPLYAKTRKKDVVTKNYLFPVVHVRKGEALRGWQVRPIVGTEHKDITSRTNSLDELEVVAGHDKFFALWPIFFKNKTGIGTENPERQLSVLPLFTTSHSPQRDSTTAPWPIGLTLTTDRVKNYREIGAPWPLIVFAHGEGKNTKRVWPIFSRSSNSNLVSNFYLWPVYKYNRFVSDPLDRKRTRILFFLYSDILEKNLAAGDALHRVDFWPLYTFRRDHNGNQRLQVLSILEPLLPNNKSIERDYSPLWALWRAEKNPATHSSSQSLLWNLFRRDAAPGTKKCSLLFGLFQYESSPEAKRFRLFYFPFKRAGHPDDSPASGKVQERNDQSGFAH